MKERYKQWLTFFNKNKKKIAIVVVVHFGFALLLLLPYFNLLSLVLSFINYLVDWILILVFFRPRKKTILEASFVCMIMAYLFHLIGLESVAGILGDLCYFMIATFLIMSVRHKKEESA